jgi:CBS domain-containing protein
VEGDFVVGVLSEFDLLSTLCPPARTRSLSLLDHLTARSNARAPRHGTALALVREAMSTAVFAVGPDESVWTAAREMQRRKVKRLPVMEEGGRLVGIISRADLVRAMARGDESIHADVLHALQSLGKDSENVNVSVAQGFVTLAGVAHDDCTVRVAAELAYRVPGVAGVRNLIDQQPGGVDFQLGEDDMDRLDPFAAGQRAGGPSPGGS